MSQLSIVLVVLVLHQLLLGVQADSVATDDNQHGMSGGIIESDRLRSRLFDDFIKKQQLSKNEIGVGLSQFPARRWPWELVGRHSSHPMKNTYSGANLEEKLKVKKALELRRRGFYTRPRTVESPAISVDSQSGGKFIKGLAKVLDVKQGHYSEIYDKIDRPHWSTKKPADAIEESIKGAVQRFLAKRRLQLHHNQNTNHHQDNKIESGVKS